MKNLVNLLLGILVSALLLIVQSITYAMTYDLCITKVVVSSVIKCQSSYFEMFIMIEVFRQLIISVNLQKTALMSTLKAMNSGTEYLIFCLQR